MLSLRIEPISPLLSLNEFNGGFEIRIIEKDMKDCFSLDANDILHVVSLIHYTLDKDEKPILEKSRYHLAVNEIDSFILLTQRPSLPFSPCVFQNVDHFLDNDTGQLYRTYLYKSVHACEGMLESLYDEVISALNNYDILWGRPRIKEETDLFIELGFSKTEDGIYVTQIGHHK